MLQASVLASAPNDCFCLVRTVLLCWSFNTRAYAAPPYGPLYPCPEQCRDIKNVPKVTSNDDIGRAADPLIPAYTPLHLMAPWPTFHKQYRDIKSVSNVWDLGKCDKQGTLQTGQKSVQRCSINGTQRKVVKTKKKSLPWFIFSKPTCFCCQSPTFDYYYCSCPDRSFSQFSSNTHIVISADHTDHWPSEVFLPFFLPEWRWFVRPLVCKPVATPPYQDIAHSPLCAKP